MLDLYLRTIVEKVTYGVAVYLGKWISPNQMTGCALICGVLAAVCVYSGDYGLGLGLWVLNRVLDGLDGPIARAYKLQSDWGGYLDIVSDFIVYALVPAALQVTCLPVLLAVYVLNTVSLFQLSALLDSPTKTTSVSMPPALVEGMETIVVYTLALLYPHHSVCVTQDTLFRVFTLAISINILQRLQCARQLP